MREFPLKIAAAVDYLFLCTAQGEACTFPVVGTRLAAAESAARLSHIGKRSLQVLRVVDFPAVG